MSGMAKAAGIATVAAVTMLAAQSAGAQAAPRYDQPTGIGYIGGSLGTTRVDRDCVPGFSCDDSNVGGKLFLGNRFGRYFGAELTYLRPGDVERAGGKQESEGVALSLLGFLPFDNNRFEVFGRVGTTYGWTKTSTAPGFANGKERGFEPHYGIGAAYNFTASLSARVEWERHRFEYVQGDDDVNLVTVGVAWRFNAF